MTMTKTEAFSFLGMPPGTYTKEDVKGMYRKLSMKFHPDMEGGSTQKFQQLDEAYRIAIGEQRAKGEGFGGGWSGWDDLFRQARASRARAEQQRQREQYREEEQERQKEYRKGRYDYSSKQSGSRGTSWGGYKVGASCGRGNHKWVDHETYMKCSVCNSLKTKHTRAKSTYDYRSKVGRM